MRIRLLDLVKIRRERYLAAPKRTQAEQTDDAQGLLTSITFAMG